MKATKNSKKSNIISRNKFCFMSAGIAGVIMLFAYLVWEFFPFGENIILRMDLYHQYAPLYAELYERVFGGDSLIYSFTSGLGSSFLGNYFNYLSSPTLLFVLLFGHINVPEAIAAIVLFKAAASSYTFTYFLGKITNKCDISTSAFGLLYAFSGYFIAYYWNIMWLDAVVVFPLVMLGIWYIIEKGKPQLYICSLAFVMMTNYYMAYMTCILSVVFFLYFYFSHYSLGDKMHNDIIIKAKYKKTAGVTIFNSRFLVRGFTFAGSSVLAAMIAAFALLPVFFILQTSSATNSSFPSSFSTYFNIFDFFANHMAGVEPTIRSSGDAVYPNIYCGIITLILVPLFMFSKKFSLKEKIATTAVIGFFFLSFNINILNYIWHGFHFPNDLPYRFSFAYSFFMIFIAYRVITKIGRIGGKEILMSACGVAAFSVIVEKIGSANVDQTVVWTTVSFAIVYAVILAFLKNPKYAKASISILLLTAVCAEILIADTPNYKVTQTKESYTKSYEDTAAVIDKIEELEGEDGFYRMELATLLTRMDNSWFYYPGVSTFTSMAYEKVANLQYCLGLYGNEINSYTYNCQTGLYNSMMSLKYIVDNHSYVPTDNYKPVMDGNFLFTKVDTHNDMTIYKNNYWLPVAFSVNEGTDVNWVHNNGDEYRNDINPFASQNDFYFNASGVADILEPLKGVVSDTRNVEEVDAVSVEDGSFNVYKTNTSEKSNEITFKYEVAETQNIYVYIDAADVDSALISAGGFTYNQSIDNDPYILDVGTVKAGTDLYISYSIKDDKISSSVNQYVYGMNKDKFIDAYNKINAGGVLDVTKNTESRIEGTIKLAEGKMVYTSIPYDEGWAVYVDGVKLDDSAIVRVGDALMGVYMDSGEHTVEFKYSPRGFALGLGVSAVGILLFVLMLILKKKEKFFFSPSFRADVVELGKWRDAEAESEKAAALETEALADEVIEYNDAQTDVVTDAESSWEEALAAAESLVKTAESEEQTEAEAVTPEAEETPADGSNDVIELDNDICSDNDFDDAQDSSDDEDLFDPAIFADIMNEANETELIEYTDEELDEILNEFEKATDEIEEHSHAKVSADDKKAAGKKKVNIIVFAVIIILAAAIAAGIMIFAAKNRQEPPVIESETTTDEADETVADIVEDTSVTELTTVSTTRVPETTTVKASETTTKKPETTTKKPAETTTRKPAETTTKAPVTEYTGKYVEYTLKYGDTYFSILRDHGITPTVEKVEFFCSINGVTLNTVLMPGVVLKVPLDF